MPADLSENCAKVLYNAEAQRIRKAFAPKRRKELVDLALSCCALFDAANVLDDEKCYVGQLCQRLLEFPSY